MMGFGSYAYGGSSSASNLSALAPPFTVDRSAPKTNSNPIVDFNVELPYAMAMPLNSSFHSWAPPHYPTATEDDSIHASNGFKYPVSQPITSPATSVNPVAAASTCLFPYGPCSEGIATTLAEAKPYYPSFVSQAIHNDSPAELPHQAGYDLLSSSYASALNGSTHDECADSLTGLEYTPQWTGMWNGLADWNRDKRVATDGNFYPRETANAAGPSNYQNYLNQGTNASKGLSTFEELPRGNDMIIQEKGVGSLSEKLLDDESFSGKNPNFVPIGYSNTSILGSAIFPETHANEPSVEYITNPTKHKMTYGSHDEGMVLHDLSMNLSTSDALATPASRRPAFGTSYFAPNTSSLKTANVTKDVANMDSAGGDSSGVKETNFLRSSDVKGHFEAGHIGIRSTRSDHFLVESSARKYDELSINKFLSNDTSDTFFEADSGIQIPQVRLDILNAPLDFNESATSAEKLSETLDHHSTAVDSPCWKGVPFSRFSPFKVSEAATPQQLKKETCYGLNLQGTQGFALGVGASISSQVPGENSFFHESGYVKNGFVPPLRKSSVDHAMESGFCYSKLIHESKKDCTFPCVSVGNSDKFFNAGQQLSEDGETATEKMFASGASVTCSRMNIIDAMEDGSSDVPFTATESALRSPPSVEIAPPKPSKFPEEQPTSKMNVKALIKTMHDLSEMLVIHWSNDACIVKGTDLETLNIVINNLKTCVRKNPQQRPPVQDSLLSHGGSCEFGGQLPDPHKGVRVDGPQVTAAVGVHVHNQLDHQPTLKETKDHIMVVGKDEEIVPPRGDENFINDDNMTQTIKKVLDENFDDEEETSPQILLYKNLWLEAEAAICSINYKARYNRMKIEMEKNKLLEAKDVIDNAMDLKQPSCKVSPILSTVNNDFIPEANIPNAAASAHGSSMISTNGHADDVMARLRILKCRFDYSNSSDTVNEQDSSTFRVSPDFNNGEHLANDPKDGPVPDVSLQHSHIINSTSNSDDVMSRYRILKCRIDGSNSMNIVDEDIWNSRVATDLNKVEKLGTEGKDSQTPDISAQDSSPISSGGTELNKIEKLGTGGKGTQISDISFQDLPIPYGVSHGVDVEPSVLARFHVLKCRTDNSSSLDMEGEQVLDVDLGFGSKSNYWSITSNGLWEGKSNANLNSGVQHDIATYCEEKSAVNEQASHRPGNQRPGGWHDGSSDWEHVLKDDLPGQS